MNPTLTTSEPQTARNGGGTPRVEYVTPPANILESKDGYVLEAEMPGVSKDGLEVTVENGELTILGHRAPAESKGREVYRESRHFDYRRSFELDPSIDTAKITAKTISAMTSCHTSAVRTARPPGVGS